MTPITELHNLLCSVSGIVSAPSYYRYDRNQIFIFVNNRWIKNIDITKAIMKGYAGQLPPQKFPAAAIFITLPADQVDVNIHPKKEEIKFLHPKKIEAVIINSLKATFEEFVSRQILTPSSSLQAKTEYASFSFDQKPVQETHHAWQQDTIKNLNSVKFNTVDHHRSYQPQQNSLNESNDDQTIEFTPPVFAAHAFQAPLKINPPAEHEQVNITEHHEVAIIGQYKTTYILFEKDNNLIFVDQHAAHERILYEQFKKNFTDIATVQLIFPEFIKLPAHDIMTIAPYLSLLCNHGISAEIFSDTQLMIQATPVHLKNQLLQETIQQIISWINTMDETDPERISHLLHEKIHTKMACSAAIKAGDKLNIEQMQQLLHDLSRIEHRYSCPHGRPTFWVLPIEDIEKKFKRDYGKKSEQFYDFLS
jgi:DNA mismatch repair protein MutL